LEFGLASGNVVLFVIGGALNLFQRSFQKLPPTDGVVWTQKADGFTLKKLRPDLRLRAREFRSATV
jgi:hypothetical protein